MLSQPRLDFQTNQGNIAMTRYLTIAIGLSAVLLLSGCATTSKEDIDKLAADIATAQKTADEAKAMASNAQTTAIRAEKMAEEAKAAADRSAADADRALREAEAAKAEAQRASEKADRMFKKAIAK